MIIWTIILTICLSCGLLYAIMQLHYQCSFHNHNITIWFVSNNCGSIKQKWSVLVFKMLPILFSLVCIIVNLCILQYVKLWYYTLSPITLLNITVLCRTCSKYEYLLHIMFVLLHRYEPFYSVSSNACFIPCLQLIGLYPRLHVIYHQYSLYNAIATLLMWNFDVG